MYSNELSVTYSPGRRWLNLLLFAVIMVLGGLRLYEGIENDKTPTIIYGLAFIALSVFGALQLLRYRVIVGDGYIEQHALFGGGRLVYTEVLQAKERKRTLNLIGPTQKVQIRQDIERFDEVTKKIAEKLNALPVLRTEGDLTKWKIADRDDEGRLIKR